MGRGFIFLGTLISLHASAVLVRAAPAWYSGDITLFSSRNTATIIQDRVRQGMDSGLDWIVLSGRAEEGIFIGLQETIQEHDLNMPRINPIIAAAWSPSGAPGAALILFGIDPRAPVPRDSLSQVITWVESQNGVVLHTSPDLPAELDAHPSQIGNAFQGIRDGEWNQQCEPGAGWDSLLTTGHRIVLVGGSDEETSQPGSLQKTYVHAESNLPDKIVSAIKGGAAFVAQADGIRIDLRINGRSLGSTVPLAREAYVRFRAHSRDPISRVLLVADGEVVWTANPDTAVWEERFFLSLVGKTYVRPIVESAAAGYRTMGNPIFLISEPDEAEAEFPWVEQDFQAWGTVYSEVEGALLEVADHLRPQAKARVVSELLSDNRMQFPTVRVLQDRSDLLPDSFVWELAQHPDPEVRLGATYALVSRAPIELSGLLLNLIQNDSLRVREYAARMLFQYSDGVDNDLVKDLLGRFSPPVEQYLIRSLDPMPYDPDLVRYLILSLESDHSGKAAASVDKLVEMGARNFKVIKRLIDSARRGNQRALEPVGWIGDRRTIPELEKLFERESPGPLRRAVFLALEKMGVPYIGRKEAICSWMPVPPTLDGLPVAYEWDPASALIQFAEDSEGAPPDRRIRAWIGYDSRRFYLSVTCELDTLPQNQPEDRMEFALSPEEGEKPLRFFSVTPADVARDGKITNPDLRVAAILEPGKWSMEGEIPLEAIGLDDQDVLPPVRFNLAVIEGGTRQKRWSWSVTYGNPRNPLRFGSIAFDVPPAEINSPDE